MKKRLLTAMFILVFLISLTSCKKETKDVIRLNEVVHSVFYAPQYVALELGFFEDEGLDIELSTGWGADKSMTALLSNNADIALMGPEASVYVYQEGQENYAINFAALTQRAGNFLIGRDANKDFTWEQVKGTTIIGGRPGGMPQLVLEYILKKNDIEPFRDVTLITNIQFSATAGSFIAGTGTYTTEFEPTASRLENEEKGYVVASLGTASGNVPYTSYMATKGYIEENPLIVEKFTKALYKGQKYVATHTPEDIAKIIAPQFKDTDAKLLVQIIKRYKTQQTWTSNPLFPKDSYNLLLDILKEGNQIDHKVPFETLINNDFAEKVLE